MASTFFDFKQFRVWHHACAMKVGTDAVLLGLCVEQDETVKDVLDIGTGSGVIALIIAQRNLMANILGIELDEAACEQASQNFAQSPWKDRLIAKQISLQMFVEEGFKIFNLDNLLPPNEQPVLANLSESKGEQNDRGQGLLFGLNQFDCVVSNPPFFEANRNYSIENLQRSKARHDAALPFTELANGASHLLKPSGKFWLILPAKEASIFARHAAENGLFLSKEIAVIPAPGKPIKRLIHAYQKTPAPLVRTELILQNVEGKPSADYIEMSKDFYLRIDL
jgi:tRNA1Val (adenine37-N6)-methyltransferase